MVASHHLLFGKGRGACVTRDRQHGNPHAAAGSCRTITTKSPARAPGQASDGALPCRRGSGGWCYLDGHPQTATRTKCSKPGSFRSTPRRWRGATMVSIEDERLPRRKQPEVAPLTAPTGGNSHQFKRVEGRTYSVCTVCGVLMRTPAENAATSCIPKT